MIKLLRGLMLPSAAGMAPVIRLHEVLRSDKNLALANELGRLPVIELFCRRRVCSRLPPGIVSATDPVKLL